MTTTDKTQVNDAGKTRRLRWWARLVLVGIIVAAGVTESALRYLRYDEFPIYDVDPKIGYIPKPNQTGSFAGRYSWTLNERSMLNGPWVPDREHGILVISDSLVWGEVKMAARDKLGACLQASVGNQYRIWSVGAGSWANLNEVEYLTRNEDVVRNIHGMVWIANSGDFGNRSVWSSDFTHPRRRPSFLLGYLIGKVSVPWMKRLVAGFGGQHDNGSEEDAEVSAETAKELRAWLKRAPPDLLRHSLFVWYPDAAEFKARSTATSHLLSAVRGIVEAEGFRFLDLRGESRWRRNYYRDPIHPSPEGNLVLASILQDHLPSDDRSTAPP